MYQRLLAVLFALVLVGMPCLAQSGDGTEGEAGFRLLTPTVGQQFQAGEVITLSFSAEGINLDPGSSIKLEYQIVGETAWHVIVEGLYAAETFEWIPSFGRDREISIRAVSADDQGNELVAVVTGLTVTGPPIEGTTVTDATPVIAPSSPPVAPSTTESAKPNTARSDPPPPDVKDSLRPMIIGGIAGAIGALAAYLLFRRRKKPTS